MTFNHAVVIGASVGGLLAAAALANKFSSVTIVERDELPAEPEPRRGVPQGHQVHALLAIGIESMERLLPNIVDDFVAAGGEPIDQGSDFAILGGEGWSARSASDAKFVALRRPILEHVIRERVKQLPGVQIVPGTVTGLLASDDRSRITGVTLKLADVDQIEADFVVDSSGRSSRSTRWIADLGYGQVEEKQIVATINYATALVEIPEDALPEGVRGILTPPTPKIPRGSAVMPCGNGQYQLAALGIMTDKIPTDRDAYIAYLDETASPIVGQIARRAEFLAEPVNYQLTGSRRFKWEDLPKHPERFLAIADAVMGFNPIYGQGMSAAAIEAVSLKSALEEATTLDGVARSVQQSFRPTIDLVLGLVLPLDAQFEGVELIGLEGPDDESLAAGRLLSQVATGDPTVATALTYVSHFFDTKFLADPEVQERIGQWISEGKQVVNNDPAVIPPRADLVSSS
jgi:2-polyprenyl-6-methoxyphenol hydroxylase-like FAD-dependent oxidoreductase